LLRYLLAAVLVMPAQPHRPFVFTARAAGIRILERNSKWWANLKVIQDRTNSSRI
jgi:hypothetical protein